MDKTYRLFLPLRNPELHPDQILEWQFTKRDFEFLQYQYACGGLEKQHDKQISLFLGEVFLREFLNADSIFSADFPLSEVENSIAESSRDRASVGQTSQFLVSIFIANGDLMFNIINASNAAPEKFKISFEISMLELEGALDLVEACHPGLDQGWLRHPGAGIGAFILAPMSGPLRDYDVSFAKVIRLKSKEAVRVSARSKAEAHEKALGFAPELEYEEDEINYHVNDNIREVKRRHDA